MSYFIRPDQKGLVAFAFALAGISFLGSSGMCIGATTLGKAEEALRLKSILLTQSGGQTGILINLSRTPQKVEHFALTNPSRIVIDIRAPLAGESSTITRPVADDPHVSRVRIGTREGRLRIAVDLNDPPPKWTVKEDATAIAALLGEPSDSAPSARSQLVYAEASETTSTATTQEPAAVPKIQFVKAEVPKPEAAAEVTDSLGPPPAARQAREEPNATLPAPAISPIGLRDPFRPFNLGLRPKPAPPHTPLERYALGALKFVAVLYNTQKPRAMVEDETGFGYTLVVGTKIGNQDGVVKEIDSDRIVVEEEYLDFYGERKKSESVLRLQREGGQLVP